MRAALYARVSTEEQTEGYSLDHQLRAGREYCIARGWVVVGEFVDEGRSARSEDVRRRPAFARLLQAALAGQCDVVVVHKLDRFSRNLRLMLDLFDRLHRARVAVVSLSEQVDYTTPAGRVFLAMVGSLAQWYSDNLAQETRKGKLERKHQGLYNGLLPFGTMKGPGGLPVPDTRPLSNGKTNYDGLLLAFQLAAEGRSDREIARALTAGGWRTTGNRGANPFRKDTVRRILTNRFYMGELPDGQGGWLPGRHGALIDPALFALAQASRTARRRGRARFSVSSGRRTYALTGLLRCGYCGERLRVKWTHRQPRAACAGRVEGSDCPQPGLPLAIYEAQVEEWLKAIAIPDEAVQAALRAVEEQEETQDTGEVRQRLEQRLERLRDLYAWGDIDRETYMRERDEVLRTLQRLQPKEQQRADIERTVRFLRSVLAQWRAADPERRNRLLGELVEEIVVKDNQVVGIRPRPEVALWVSGCPPRVGTSGSDGDRFTTLPHRPRYWVPLGRYRPERLREIAALARQASISRAAREAGVSRQTVRKALSIFAE